MRIGLALKSATDELKTQVAIILGNINGISERLDRLEQAHGDISERLDRLEQAHAKLERQVLDMLTNTLPSSAARIIQLDHQVNEYVQSEIDRLESRLNKHEERFDRIEVTDR